LPDSTPVLVNVSNPWTSEKLAACLNILITVPCRLQKTIGSGQTATYDSSDTTYMAQAMFQHYANSPYPVGTVERPYNYTYLNFIYRYGYWDFSSVVGATRNETFSFTDNLTAYGFGPTVHRGYVGVRPPYEWRINGGWEKHTMRSVMPPTVTVDQISKTFTASAGDSAWLMADSSNYCESAETADYYDYPPGTSPTLATHWTGFFSFAAKVLSTLSPPPLAEAATLIMDCDRDGAITTNDLDRVDQSHPFRFWVNDDGNAATYPEANLEDFFPAQLRWAEGEGQPDITFKLSANVNLNYIPTSMTTNDTDSYLTDLTVATALSGSGSIQALSSGTQTTETFSENDIVLLAASAAKTNAQIYVHILQNGSQMAVSTNYFSFSPVTNMYRTKNLRANGVSSMGEPSNWPDELTNGKDFVFVHGYNVDETAGREWNSAIFKRLWFAGSNARFHGILWDGTPPTAGLPNMGYHYHNSVINAFATASSFSTYLNSLTEPVVMAHSLGNMLAGSAICDHSASISQYYAVDAAVALEAYGDVAPTSALIPQTFLARNNNGWLSFIGYQWTDYPAEMRPYRWYERFVSGDARSELTWRNRFADIQSRTDVFNFYSSTEDVLRTGDGFTTFLNAVSVGIHTDYYIPTGFSFQTGQYAWQIQEMYKGRSGFFGTGWIPGLLGGGSSKYAGWDFVKDSGNYYYTFLGLNLWPKQPRIWQERLSTSNPDRNNGLNVIRDDPLFLHEPAELFGAGAESFASGTVASYGSALDYNTSNDTVPTDNVLIRDWLIAKAFPATTRPMGATHVGDIGGGWADANFNMHSLYMTDLASWPSEDMSGNKIWKHSDFMDVPYVHVYKLFEKITTQED